MKNMSPTICIWEDLTLEDTMNIIQCESPQDLKQLLKRKFQLDPDANKKDRIILDLYYYALAFSKEKQFTKEQTSAFFSIVKKTHVKATETSYGNTEETFSFFKDTLACHAVKRPPFCIELFNLQETTEITEYVLNTYFRHLKLYKYAFTSKVVMNLNVRYNGLEEELEPEVAETEPETEDQQDSEVAVEELQPDGDLMEKLHSEEDSPAVKELKKMIKVTVDEQVNELKTSIEQKLKANEELLMKTISGSQNTAEGAPAKLSRRGKRK